MGLVRSALAGLLALILLGAGCASAAPPTRSATKVRHLPPVAAIADYQLGGSYRPAKDVRIVDRDRTSSPARGRYNICYLNAFQTQPEENGFWRAKHRSLLLRVRGHYVQDPGWPGEYLLDTSTAAKRSALIKVVGSWIDGCAPKGFAAVEPDNLDSWTRQGVRGAITRADNVAFARLLIARAHARGLAIAQKNTAGLDGVRIGFDFAVAEECQVYRECGAYKKFFGRHVIEIEYTDNPRSAWTTACRLRHGKISIILRDRDVVPRGARGYRYAHC
ncbi:endo alpha-1,4 polygalactosaminidase [uncultured Jatrophihabitans sp.]|uniref:endo alpha-1,4 polygalactosaminidase n=1 Tax=uncultured Jatrophihabitans sp. TaxID=1610747 RepID=UPI0035CB7406